MAEQAEKKPESKEPPAAAAAHGEAKKAGGGKSMPMMLGVVMILEAAVLFAGFKFLGGGAPKNAHGADLTTAGEGKKGEHGETPAAGTEKKMVEIPLVKSRPTNERTGRKIQYDLELVVTAKAENEKKVKDEIKDHLKMIEHRIRTIIAQSDPDKLGGGAEPGLETLRRQVKVQLEEIIGEGMIDDIIVPTCTPFRADF